MSGFFDFFLATLVIVPLNVFLLSRIRSRFGRDEERFLAGIYTATLLLRLSAAVLLAIAPEGFSLRALFWGDSSQYDVAGRQLNLYWSGQLLDPPELRVTGFGFGYFVGAVYWIFGRNPVLVQFLNATLGSLSVIVIYAIAKELFEEPAARWAGRFMAFFPQMIVWSAGMYKDPAILLCIALTMYAVLRLRHGFSLRLVVLFFAALLSLLTLRFYVFYIVAFATLGTFAFVQRRGLAVGLLMQAGLLAIFSAAFSLAIGSETIERQMALMSLEHVQTARSDLAESAASGLQEEADVSTPAGALAVLPTGLVYLLFAPFPWSISGVRQLLTLPETLVWYGLMPAFVRGLLYTLRHKLREALPILVFTLILTVAYAVFQGNVGTAYRQRTQITMFFFILMGVGLTGNRAEARAGAATLVPAPR